jgi:hypothetical protein
LSIANTKHQCCHAGATFKINGYSTITKALNSPRPSPRGKQTYNIMPLEKAFIIAATLDIANATITPTASSPFMAIPQQHYNTLAEVTYHINKITTAIAGTIDTINSSKMWRQQFFLFN